jgi:CHAT domain
MTTKILILAANPQKTDRLLLEEEQRLIREIRQKSEARPDLEIEISPAVRWGDVQDYLRDFKPQIVHFMGHGEASEGLVLIDDQLQPHLMTGDRWAELFSLYPVDCVVLNACSTAVQAEEIHTHVNCVVGMWQKMGDKSAREFSEGFYGEIFAGAEYARAFEAGRMRIGKRIDGMQPMLLFREGVKKPVELEQPGGRMPIDTLESFVGSLNWVKKRARSLYGLLASQEDKLVGAIKQARKESTLDFYPIEIDVLELASHYIFYCLQDRPSPTPTFRKMPKKEYVRKLTELAQKGQQIRVGQEKLSILVRESENRLEVKECLSKIIEKFEVRNEI